MPMLRQAATSYDIGIKAHVIAPPLFVLVHPNGAVLVPFKANPGERVPREMATVAQGDVIRPAVQPGDCSEFSLCSGHHRVQFALLGASPAVAGRDSPHTAWEWTAVGSGRS